jgi:hypothetical protein
MSSILTLLIILAVLVFALALAWVPMSLVVQQMARNVHQFIQRQRERRNAPREAPDRRKVGI